MDMSDSDYPHLLPTARLFAQAAPQERIRRVRMDRWIGYPRAESALARLEELLTYPQCTRMPNMILRDLATNPVLGGHSSAFEKKRHPRCGNGWIDDYQLLTCRSG
jgi:hypothetical protein